MSIHNISATIKSALLSAGLDPHSPSLSNVSETIRKALSAAGLTTPKTPPAASNPPPFTPPDGVSPSARAPIWRRPAPAPRTDGDARASNVRPDVPVQESGRFTSHTLAIGSASRAYKLYVPASYREDPVPLILMLHGCKQNPDDFAAGTRMNELAEEHGFLVAYPAQSARANGANCWNWFNRAEQERDGEEPSLLAGIVDQIAASHRVDTTRVYVAGLSAGASMAVILGATHPEVFSAVGAHSGLPVGAAHDVPSAFAAMQGRRAGLPGQPSAMSANRRAVPTIVFHGDADMTVTASNGGDIVAQAVEAFADVSPLMKHVLPKATDDGRASTTTRFVDAEGQSRVERWDVHGGSHAWFGGSSAGSYTDSTGPDASAEMVRFFLEQRA